MPAADYVEIVNPSASDRNVLRHTLMTNMLETAVNNARYQAAQQVFEVGKVYLGGAETLPDEPLHVAILLTGERHASSWQDAGDSGSALDFFDMKGIVENLLHDLHIGEFAYERGSHCGLHPGRSADLLLRGERIGSFGEIHPQVAERFKLTEENVVYAEIGVAPLVRHHRRLHAIEPLPTTPAILEDIALIVDGKVAAKDVEAVIRQAGGPAAEGRAAF